MAHRWGSALSVAPLLWLSLFLADAEAAGDDGSSARARRATPPPAPSAHVAQRRLQRHPSRHPARNATRRPGADAPSRAARCPGAAARQ